MFSRGVHVESVDRTRFCRVPVDSRSGDKWGDGDFTGACVCDVQSAVVRGEGDAIGLLEGVFHESWLTCLRVEAEGPGSHLGRLGVDGIAAAIVFQLSPIFSKFSSVRLLTIVGTPYLALSVYIHVIHGAEVVSIVVVQQRSTFPRFHV